MAMFEIHAVDEQIKALPTVDTASGSVASFETDLSENLISCIAEIVATGGGGTPDSPIAINGFSECNVTRTGKNLFNPIVYNSFIQADQTYRATGNAVIAIKVSVAKFIGKQLTFSVYIDVSGGTAPNNLRVRANVNGTNIEGNFITSVSGVSSVTFTPQTVNDYIYINFGSMGGNYFTFYNIQLEQSDTATTYEPFGTTFTVNFGQTVYDGTVDVVTGKLTDTVGKLDKTDFPSMGVVYNTEVGIIRSFYLSLPTDYRYPDTFIKSNVFQSQPLSGDHAYDCEVLPTTGNAGRRIYFSISNVDHPSMTAEEAKQFLIDNNVEFYFTKYTADTIDVNSVAIPTLNGINNLYADTGDISEVKYLLTVGKKIS